MNNPYTKLRFTKTQEKDYKVWQETIKKRKSGRILLWLMILREKDPGMGRIIFQILSAHKQLLRAVLHREPADSEILGFGLKPIEDRNFERKRVDPPSVSMQKAHIKHAKIYAKEEGCGIVEALRATAALYQK